MEANLCCVFCLSQKLVLVKVVTLHIPIIGKWIIKVGGAKNGYNTNTMECGEQTIYCAFEEYGLVFLWIPLRDLES